MLQIESTILPYPNSFSFDDSTVRGKHLLLGGGYTRKKAGKKISIQLGWTNLTKSEKDSIEALYNQQFTTFQTLTFLFENAKMNEDIGPIEVFMNYASKELKGQDRYKVNLSLIER